MAGVWEGESVDEDRDDDCQDVDDEWRRWHMDDP